MGEVLRPMADMITLMVAIVHLVREIGPALIAFISMLLSLLLL